MIEPKLLLCTDMDRTLIANGEQPEQPEALRILSTFCQLPNVVLVYVTGRDQALVKEAIVEYALPMPDFAITDVGTKIYRVSADEWQAWPNWEAEISRDWRGKVAEDIQRLLVNVKALELQEPSKQNTHKLSYYLSLDEDEKSVLRQVESKLSQVDVSLIWSVDEQANIGLLDVLPRNATKLHAIEFLQQALGYDPEEVIFAGDSGNDLPVLVSGIQSVLVANASDSLRNSVQQQAQVQGHQQSLYLAKADDYRNGNYADGILQGVWHYAVEFRNKLQDLGFSEHKSV